MKKEPRVAPELNKSTHRSEHEANIAIKTQLWAWIKLNSISILTGQVIFSKINNMEKAHSTVATHGFKLELTSMEEKT